MVNNSEQKPYTMGPTSADERAFSLIHEALHLIDPAYSDGFLGRVIKNKTKDMSKDEGSKAINSFIKENCQ